MTETIKTVLLNYAVCAFVGGILEYLAPQKTKNVLRIAVFSVLLLGLFSPFVKNEVSFDGIIPQSENVENSGFDALMHTANLTERKIRREIKEILINEGINEYEIYISTAIDENENTVFLEEIKIQVAKSFEEKIPLIKSKIPDEYKTVLEVGVKNE